jgi:hypothetical protein
MARTGDEGWDLTASVGAIAIRFTVGPASAGAVIGRSTRLAVTSAFTAPPCVTIDRN